MQHDPYERRIVQEEMVQTPRGADSSVVEQRVRIEPTPVERRLGTLRRAQQIVWFVVGVSVALIALRFVLLLLGADTSTGFGNLILNLTQPFVTPFLPLFGEQTARVELGDLIAIIVYILAGWGISKLLEILLSPRTPTRYY